VIFGLSFLQFMTGLACCKFSACVGCEGAGFRNTQMAVTQCENVLPPTMNGIILFAINSIRISEKEKSIQTMVPGHFNPFDATSSTQRKRSDSRRAAL
jgi:hypothetical protein